MEPWNLTSEVYKECRRNHAAGMGVHDAFDGCREYIWDRTKQHGMYCQACGCHRNFHEKVILWEDEDKSGTKMIKPISSRKQILEEDEEGGFIVLAAGDKGRLTNKHHPAVALAAGSAHQQQRPPIVALAAGDNVMGKAKEHTKPTSKPQKPEMAKQQTKQTTKPPRVRFTEKQIAAMTKVAESLGWTMQKISADGKYRIQSLCEKHGVTRKQFVKWMGRRRSGDHCQGTNTRAESTSRHEEGGTSSDDDCLLSNITRNNQRGKTYYRSK